MKFGVIFLTISIQFFAMLTPVWGTELAKHHTTEGFRNYPVIEESANLGFAFYWKRFISSFRSPSVPEEHVLPQDQAINLYQRLRDENTITWIGQSTLLLKIKDVTILTDPFFSKYASPFLVGPSRYVKAGIKASDLPAIDIILISHNHYDHLDVAFLKTLPNKDVVKIFVPLNLKAFFSELGFKIINEMDWYESKESSEFRFTALPSVHYSGRGFGEKNKSLWCAWAIISPFGRYLFVGDSAYSPVLFKQIGDKFTGFDLAMVGIGTYGNRKYGVNNHTTPEEALLIGKEVNAKTLLGIHWGTIDLSDEDPWEPPKRFRASSDTSTYRAEDIWIMKIGETRVIPRS